MAKKEISVFIQQWLAGDEPSFGEILEFYYPRLLASSLRMVPIREDAEELVMNAMLKIWQYRHRMSEVRQFDNYLFGILRQQVVTLSRKRVMLIQNIEELPLADLGTVAHPEFALAEVLSRYRAALDKLSPKQREVFLALREHDQSRKETAERTGMSIHTVNSHMNTALKILRQEMKEYPEALVGILVGSSFFQ
ncbi:sigma-70 family RNA polymerase sigma factor [Pedobacter polaris]|uniref:Sigma-70 family RNA polymerase sigma factor n=1 Tax=Pedobacter polaris TaxID=2571273 RepID=A0A4U1CMV3_9SPHI|nr:sigma-70 family RNA polymerase sigma factor [Pedobacter polaris]TKC06653.1 sigma-70 family RNA polymerase sigma factor [Pedobacter polaris]